MVMDEYSSLRASTTAELGNKLLETVSKASMNKVVVPIIERRPILVNIGGVEVSQGQFEDVVVGFRIKTEETKYKEPHTSDVVSSYFKESTDDMKLERLFMSTVYATKSFGDRYGNDLSDAHNFIVDHINCVALTAKARDAFTARLAKTDVQISEGTQKQWIADARQSSEQKKGLLGMFGL